MALNAEYVIRCGLEEERQLVRELEELLERKLSDTRKLSKKSGESLLKAQKPFKLSHYHFGMKKEDGLYAELQANRDTAGKLQVPAHPGHEWVLRTRVNAAFTTANGRDPETVARDVDARLRAFKRETLFVRNQA